MLYRHRQAGDSSPGTWIKLRQRSNDAHHPSPPPPPQFPPPATLSGRTQQSNDQQPGRDGNSPSPPAPSPLSTPASSRVQNLFVRPVYTPLPPPPPPPFAKTPFTVIGDGRKERTNRLHLLLLDPTPSPPIPFPKRLSFPSDIRKKNGDKLGLSLMLLFC